MSSLSLDLLVPPLVWLQTTVQVGDLLIHTQYIILNIEFFKNTFKSHKIDKK